LFVTDEALPLEGAVPPLLEDLYFCIPRAALSALAPSEGVANSGAACVRTGGGGGGGGGGAGGGGGSAKHIGISFYSSYAFVSMLCCCSLYNLFRYRITLT